MASMATGTWVNPCRSPSKLEDINVGKKEDPLHCKCAYQLVDSRDGSVVVFLT